MTDPADPAVVVFSRLRDRQVRSLEKKFVAESTPVLKRLFDCWPGRVERLLIDQRRWPRLGPIIAPHLERAVRRGQPIECMIANEDVITAIAGFHVHRGVLAAGVRPGIEDQRRMLGRLRSMASDHDEMRCRTLVALDGVADVDNIGSIIRLAAGFACNGLILSPTCGDPLYRKAIRVSMGQVFRLDWVHLPIDDVHNIDEALRPGDSVENETDGASFNDSATPLPARCPLIAVETSARAKPCWEYSFPRNACLVFGAEDRGISPGLLDRCDEVVSIPMPPHVTSVNVAVSAAIVLYERQRQMVQTMSD